MKILQRYYQLFFIILISVLGLSACGTAYSGRSSDHFDGSRFFNPKPDHTFMDMVKWLWEMETVEWPEWVEDSKQPPPKKIVAHNHLRVTYINQATVLIQMDGLNILTDPIWSFRASPMTWIGPKRVRAPGVALNKLPEIDYILISHDHYDHLDLPTLKKLIRHHNPTVLTGLGVKKLLASKGLGNTVEMDWWDTYSTKVPDVNITFVPSRHGSGRGPFSGNKTLWGGYVIETPAGQVYYAGDTGFGDFIYLIQKRYTRVRLAILPIGSYEKRWFMKSQHMNPDDALRVHKILNARQSMGFHYGTFIEHPEQTIDAHEKDLSIGLRKYKIQPEQFWILKFGEGRNVQ